MEKTATNSANMKSGNRRLILNIIKKKPVSRADLARITGLTRAAVTLIVDELLREGILLETGTVEADFGRKPVLLDLNPHGYYGLGLSITRSGCHISIMNLKGELVKRRGVFLEDSLDSCECLKIITKEIKKLIENSTLPYEKLLGLGVSMPGPVDIHTGTVLNPPNFGRWHHVKIVQELKNNFLFPVFLENNSASLAIAEKNYGWGKEFDHFMLMVVDSGIGAGIVLNNKLYRGAGGFGSEVGHTSIDMNGIPCSCGNRGCLEVYASIPAMVGRIRQYDTSITCWKEIVDKAMDGERIYRNAIDTEAQFLSMGIINAMNILDLDAVVLTGDVNYKPRMLLDRISEIVESTFITRDYHKISILSSQIEENAEELSAASIIIDKYFNGDIG